MFVVWTPYGPWTMHFLSPCQNGGSKFDWIPTLSNNFDLHNSSHTSIYMNTSNIFYVNWVIVVDETSFSTRPIPPKFSRISNLSVTKQGRVAEHGNFGCVPWSEYIRAANTFQTAGLNVDRPRARTQIPYSAVKNQMLVWNWGYQGTGIYGCVNPDHIKKLMRQARNTKKLTVRHDQKYL